MLLDTIDKFSISDNVIFVFTADNGPEKASHGNNNTTIETGNPGSAGPWRNTIQPLK